MLQFKTDGQTPDVSCSSIDEVKNIRDKLSLKVLRTLDQDIQSIIHKTPFVTLYEMSNERWTRAGIEGFLYIVMRSINPIYSFVIINKKSETHLIEHITPEFQMNHNGNFIFYSTERIKAVSQNKLNGLWFFDENECKNTYEKILNITTNSAPLHYSLGSPLLDLCDNLDPKDGGSNFANLTKSTHRQKILESTEKNHESTKFNIFSRIMPNANINDTRNINVANKQNEYSEDAKTNKEGQRLINMLYSYGKTEQFDVSSTQKLEIPTSSKKSTPKADSNMTVSYNDLKSAIGDVINSDEFASLVWERLQTISFNAESYS
ncbi:Dcp1-like decapping family domain-containing protein [Theileria equi strain WA]|uniref:Dcp1-like decapping family domain-containing protein n=1 Tax=Theileria equi strain WA TaxID=1537102 RepID=L0B2Z9_THEEQ|nr:Dcp1-like decapping family domain-containing protein [Theileria equi strain WA]AFZ81601.1 Dcp1-like decapping family domain-containing protein [Theileria equi strain WA]|eukprot:XP_004831267.1 Dcp1-like decapping family domain-containing protein [Theileria equi strain WA]